jgi:TetR/AcrR family transcriptional regulator, transcriptional repressor for nem operon
MTDTRTQILEKSYQALRLHGFQGTRADKVILDLGITKGALYHYFPSKLDLGYAIVDELIMPRYTRLWLSLDQFEGNPADGIISQLRYLISMSSEEEVRLGCPLNNLMQEMAPLDQGFQQRLQHIVNVQREAIGSALKRGQQAGQIRQEIETDPSAIFILSSLEGSYSIAKALQQREIFETSLQTLIQFVFTLKT